MNRKGRVLAGAAAILLLAIAASFIGRGSHVSAAGSRTLLFALNVPVTADPYVAGVITRGATLAVDKANAAGGVRIGGFTYKLKLKAYDDNNDPAQAAANVEKAISHGAVAVVEDGNGMAASAAQSNAADVPQIAITDGTSGLLTTDAGPITSLFGLRIPNDFAAEVLAIYIAGKTRSVAILHDDTDNGRDGATQLQSSFEYSNITAKPVLEVAANAPTMDAEVLEIKSANPGAVVIWGGDLFIARALTAIRDAGIDAPVYASQQAESPAVRELDPPSVTDGLKFISGRMDSEFDNCSFPRFENALGKYRLAPVDAHVKTAAGQEVRQPDDLDFFSYDAVNVVVAALEKAGSPQPGARLLQDLAKVHVRSANGDARGFSPQAHEGFDLQDAYVAEIEDNQFEPVKDEPLSASLATEPELMSGYPVPVPTTGCPSP
ncbi:MAG TPA: ABC transporter substrate-binding protein [Acidimicrobiales bacterium]|nr:ABC transporter substrate-binding protein [Acidimicrobiales bacterium]